MRRSIRLVHRKRIAFGICPELYDELENLSRERTAWMGDCIRKQEEIDNLKAAQSQYSRVVQEHTTLVSDQATVTKYLRDAYPDELNGQTFAGLTFPQLVIHLIERNRKANPNPQ